MTRRPLKKLSYKPALKPEDLDQAVERLRRDMAEAAAQLSIDTARSDDAASSAIEVPDLSEQAEADLRALLEEETLALVEPEGARGIRANELTHEWQKKALAGLKRDTLSAIAVRRGMVPSSKLDDLAQQVAASFQWDEQVVARLVLDYAEDPKVTEGGLTSRVFMLKGPLDLGWTIDRLQYVDGRYYRTDIAKWFTFEHFKKTDTTLRIDGSLRTYTVVAGVTDQDVDRLLPEPSEFAAQLEVHEGSQVAMVHRASNATVARSVMAAFKVATRAATLNNLPNTGSGAGIRPRSLHPTTEWLLDLVTYRLRTHLFRNKNAVLARFRYTKRHQRRTAPQPQGS